MIQIIHLNYVDLNDFTKTAIDPPPPLSNGHHYYFAEYSTAELTCIAPDGLPSPTIWWEGPSGQVLTSPSQTYDSVLYLTRVLNEDAGTYRCRAGNEARNVSIQVNLVVTCKFCVEFRNKDFPKKSDAFSFYSSADDPTASSGRFSQRRRNGFDELHFFRIAGTSNYRPVVERRATNGRSTQANPRSSQFHSQICFGFQKACR